MKITFLDTETTGLDPARDQIISFSFMCWEDGAITKSASRYVLPTCECSPEAARVNGYDRDKWIALGAQPFGFEHAELAAPFLDGYPTYGGSNPKFDVDFWRFSLGRLDLPLPKHSHRMLDTSALGMPLLALGEVNGTGLVALAAYFGLSTEAAHTATGDCSLAIQVWEKFLERALTHV